MDQELYGHIYKSLSIIYSEGDVPSSDEVHIEGSVGVLRRADGDDGQAHVGDGVGRDRRGHRTWFPFFIRAGYQVACCTKPKNYDDEPEFFSCFWGGIVNVGKAMYGGCIQEFSKNIHVVSQCIDRQRVESFSLNAWYSSFSGSMNTKDNVFQ